MHQLIYSRAVEFFFGGPGSRLAINFVSWVTVDGQRLSPAKVIPKARTANGFPQPKSFSKRPNTRRVTCNFAILLVSCHVSLRGLIVDVVIWPPLRPPAVTHLAALSPAVGPPSPPSGRPPLISLVMNPPVNRTPILKLWAPLPLPAHLGSATVHTANGLGDKVHDPPRRVGHL
jgi:hypothetical protein